MGLLTWIAIGVIVLVVIGLGVGVFFSGLIRGAEIVAENPAVQNAFEEAQEFVQDRVDPGVSGDGGILIITTSKFAYSVGEPVVITVKNKGDETLAFPDSALGLEIQNTNTGVEYGAPAAQVITELEPDDSAGPGDYSATVHTTPSNSGIITAQVNFEITG
jgi:hypothetical protein